MNVDEKLCSICQFHPVPPTECYYCVPPTNNNWKNEKIVVLRAALAEAFRVLCLLPPYDEEREVMQREMMEMVEKVLEETKP